jgi:hypothetical protein
MQRKRNVEKEKGRQEKCRERERKGKRNVEKERGKGRQGTKIYTYR